MNTIKTHLRTTATDDQGNIQLSGNGAFSGVFNLGLLLGSQDPDSRRFPTDEHGLQTMKDQLESMTYDCFSENSPSTATNYQDKVNLRKMAILA